MGKQQANDTRSVVRRIKDFLWRYECFRGISDDKAIIYNIKSIWKGYKLAKKICNPMDKTTHYWVQPWHLGDTWGFLKWVRPLKMYYSAEDRVIEYGDFRDINEKALIEKVVVITTRVNAAVAEMYEDVDDIIILKSDEVKALHKYLKSEIVIHENMHTVDNGCWKATLRKVAGTRKISSMYGFNSQQYELGLPKGYENEKGKPKIKFETKRLMTAYMDENGMKIGKTVILFPYANSTDELSIVFWEKVADYLKERDYCIFTNCAPSESEIKGTKKLDMLIDKVAALVTLGCIVVGVQSGGMDVVTSVGSNSSNIVILPKKNDEQVAGNAFFAYERGAYGPSGTITHKENVTYMYFEHETEDKIFDALCKEIETGWDNGGCDES